MAELAACLRQVKVGGKALIAPEMVVNFSCVNDEDNTALGAVVKCDHFESANRPLAEYAGFAGALPGHLVAVRSDGPDSVAFTRRATVLHISMPFL